MRFLSVMALICHRFLPLPLGYTSAKDINLYSLGFLGLFAVDYVDQRSRSVTHAWWHASTFFRFSWSFSRQLRGAEGVARLHVSWWHANATTSFSFLHCLFSRLFSTSVFYRLVHVCPAVPGLYLRSFVSGIFSCLVLVLACHFVLYLFSLVSRICAPISLVHMCRLVL
jgi:hypothetical protein